MIDFFVRAWFEKREQKTKKEFASLKEKQFKELVLDVKNFCTKCWESKSWKELDFQYCYMNRYSSNNSSWAYKELKRVYEAFAKENGVHIEAIIEIYNNYYDEIWKNTDLDVTDVYCCRSDNRISYEIHKKCDGSLVPEFNWTAKGWNRKWHEAYCVLADIMLLLNKMCEIVDMLSDHFRHEYQSYHFYSVRRQDRPKSEDEAVYKEAKQKFESEINVETSIKKEDLEVEARKLVLENGFCKRFTANNEEEMSWI